MCRNGGSLEEGFDSIGGDETPAGATVITVDGAEEGGAEEGGAAATTRPWLPPPRPA